MKPCLAVILVLSAMVVFAGAAVVEEETWYNAEGKYDWTAVDRLEFDAGPNGLGDVVVGFDDIRVVPLLPGEPRLTNDLGANGLFFDPATSGHGFDLNVVGDVALNRLQEARDVIGAKEEPVTNRARANHAEVLRGTQRAQHQRVRFDGGLGQRRQAQTSAEDLQQRGLATAILAHQKGDRSRELDGAEIAHEWQGEGKLPAFRHAV